MIVSVSSQHQGPTFEHHPTIDPEIQALFSTLELLRITEFLIQAPGPMTQFSPMDTFGPIKAV